MKINKEFKDLIFELTTEEYQGLESNIIENGCLDSIKIWNDTIIDGHNRYEICTENDIEYKTQSLEFDSEKDVKVWIIDNQLDRRNLSPYQRTALALKREGFFKVIAKEQQIRKPESVQQTSVEQKPIEVNKEVAKIAGVSHDTVHKVKYIEEKATEDDKKKLNKSEVSINKVYTQTKRKEQQKNPITPIPLPKDKYRCIVVDPPWDIKKIEREVAPEQVGLDYPTMSLDKIKALDVESLSHDGCFLFLWTTHKYLPHAFDIVKEWNFNYICTMVWNKGGGFQPFGLPQYNCEFVLLCRKGNLDFTSLKSFFCCFDGKRRAHSEKPDEFYETLRRVTQEPRIDMFARNNHDGFDSWGDEANE